MAALTGVGNARGFTAAVTAETTLKRDMIEKRIVKLRDRVGRRDRVKASQSIAAPFYSEETKTANIFAHLDWVIHVSIRATLSNDTLLATFRPLVPIQLGCRLVHGMK